MITRNLADQGRLENPHLRAQAERLGLDLARLNTGRPDEAVLARLANLPA